jgi:Fe-Mn family superoxide dismutase
MKFSIPPLPYPKDALEPHISAETLDVHYEKHHKGYVKKLRADIEGKPEADKTLEELIRTANGSVFDHAAQVWNHTFYWQSMRPDGGGEPKDRMRELIDASFGSYKSFREQLLASAGSHFGSGWTWLVRGPTDRLSIRSTSDADNPLRRGLVPLATIDVWEHAYYLDYKNEKAKYLEALVDHLLNWDFIADNFAAAPPIGEGRDVEGEGNRTADRRYREGATAFAEDDGAGNDR